MLEVVNPLYFLSALGLLIPIALHFWNRKPPVEVPVGSIRWFKGSSTQTARSVQFKNLPLLLVRCLMLLVFTALVVGLIWKEESGDNSNKSRLYLIHPELAGEFSQKAIDSLQRAGWQLRLTGPGLPKISDTLRLKAQLIDIWAAMQEADVLAGISDTIRVYSLLKQEYFSGERPVLHRHFMLEEPGQPMEPIEFVYKAIRQNDTLWLQQAKVAEQGIRLDWERQPSASANTTLQSLNGGVPEIKAPKDLLVGVVSGEANKRAARIMQYALQTVFNTNPTVKLKITNDQDSAVAADLLIWLSEEELPAPESKQKQIVVRYADKTGGEAWFEADSTAGLRDFYHFNDYPLPEQVSREKLSRLPIAFADLIKQNTEDSLSRLLPMPIKQAQPLKAGGERQEKTDNKEGEDMHLWLWLLLVLLLSIERIWVYRS